MGWPSPRRRCERPAWPATGDVGRRRRGGVWSRWPRPGSGSGYAAGVAVA